jgi:hypothetical protein
VNVLTTFVIACVADPDTPTIYSVRGSEDLVYADPGTLTAVTVSLDDELVSFAGRDTWPSLVLTLSSGTWVGEEDSVLETSFAERTLTAWFNPARSYSEVVVQGELSYEGATWRSEDVINLCPAELATVALSADRPVVETTSSVSLTAAIRTRAGGAPSPGTRVTFSILEIGSGISAWFDRSSVPIDENGDATVNLLVEGAAGSVTVEATAIRPTWGDCDVSGTLSDSILLQVELTEDSG